ncbi:MAG TPA: hypothetical protein VJI96_04590 [Candidatus Andersenbacteria bacterium]|nr:hypothetical protein [Candidatus Andersenbacteria bacterium]
MRKLLIIFILFFIANIAYLHRVPGLLGDEGSEGQNVYELLHSDSITIIGERSYIGPIIDYIRIPFIAVFGYTALALRMLMLSASCITFFLAYAVLQKLFGKDVGMIALVFFVFSPIFLLQQRIGWAITLNIFFFWLLVYALMSNWKHKWLLVGLIAGIGLSNDVIFFPTLVAVCVCSLFMYLFSGSIKEKAISLMFSSWLIVVGFVAGFGTQAAVLLLFTEDQGSRREVVAGLSSRLEDYLPSLPLYISGTSYVARYTGVEFSPFAISTITLTLCIAIFISLFHKKRIYILTFLAGLAIHSYLLLYMVDRFTLRYFASFSMIVWLLAGVGLGVFLKRLLPIRAMHVAPVILAVLLMTWTAHTTLIPFLRTGGSLQEFSLGNRNDKASAFVDIRPLVSCIRGNGIVYGASQDIFDRLQYLARGNDQIEIVDGEHKKSAEFTISYKKPDDAFTRDETSICPDIPFFKVVKK